MIWAVPYILAEAFILLGTAGDLVAIFWLMGDFSADLGNFEDLSADFTGDLYIELTPLALLMVDCDTTYFGEFLGLLVVFFAA